MSDLMNFTRVQGDIVTDMINVANSGNDFDYIAGRGYNEEEKEVIRQLHDMHKFAADEGGNNAMLLMNRNKLNAKEEKMVKTVKTCVVIIKSAKMAGTKELTKLIDNIGRIMGGAQVRLSIYSCGSLAAVITSKEREDVE